MDCFALVTAGHITMKLEMAFPSICLFTASLNSAFRSILGYAAREIACAEVVLRTMKSLAVPLRRRKMKFGI